MADKLDDLADDLLRTLGKLQQSIPIAMAKPYLETAPLQSDST